MLPGDGHDAANNCNWDHKNKLDGSMVPLEMDSTSHLASDSSDFIDPCGGWLGKRLAESRNFVTKAPCVRNFRWRLFRSIFFVLILIAFMIGVTIQWARSDCKPVDWNQSYGLAFILFILVFISWGITLLKRPVGALRRKLDASAGEEHVRKFVRAGYYAALLVGVIVFMALTALDARSDPRRLISLFGYFLILCFGLLFSKHPAYIKWQTVLPGVVIHLLLGMLVIKWPAGRALFKLIGDRAEAMLSYSYVGAVFVYGDYLIQQNIFAFKALSVLFFVAVLINILFYYGVLQSFFFKLGAIMQAFLGTTIIESVNAVATVFLGMSEAPLLFRPYIQFLTLSEIHAVMTAGFSTIAGTVLAAYVSFGANPASLVTASVMAAPAALAFAKLFYPERSRSQTSTQSIAAVKSEESSVLEAACKGAFSGMEIVLGIIASLIACVSLVAFFNGLLTWAGSVVGIPHKLTFEKLVGWVFVPLAWAMGVVPSECEDVAELIGIKTVINEFVAYQNLGIKKANKLLSVRSEAIATFALCGFANPSSVAILVASLTSVCPTKRKDISAVALRAFVAGSCTSFLSACLAGLLIPEEGFNDYQLEYNSSSCVLN